GRRAKPARCARSRRAARESLLSTVSACSRASMDRCRRRAAARASCAGRGLPLARLPRSRSRKTKGRALVLEDQLQVLGRRKCDHIGAACLPVIAKRLFNQRVDVGDGMDWIVVEDDEMLASGCLSKLKRLLVD